MGTISRSIKYIQTKNVYIISKSLKQNGNIIMRIKLLAFIAFILLFNGSSLPDRNVYVNIDATKSISNLEPFWASQIIHATEFLPTEWGRDYVKVLKETGAAQQFIRIYNQPENAIRVDEKGTISYDWSRFDEMANIILSTGNKLKVVIFAMPPEIAAYPESGRKRPYGAVVCTSPPKDYKLWEEMISDFMQHVIDEFGLAEVKQWHFRCWNEPDLEGFWYQGDLNEYLKLYDHFAKAAKDVSPEIRIGGPGLSSTKTFKEPENFRFFLEHVVNGKNHATGERGSPIDFLSIQTYGGHAARGGWQREFPEVDFIMENQLRLADIRDSYPTLLNVPIYVDEWGVTAAGGKGVDSEPMADIRNSQYASAFFATLVGRHVAIRQHGNRNIGTFVYCAMNDAVPERDFMGHRKLISKHGFHKPILNAYKLLYKLAPELVQVHTGANPHITAFATRDADRITIVVTNFQNDQIYNEGRSYPITLNFKTGWYPEDHVNLKHWRIDEEYSNSYTAFKEIGSPKLPNPLEVDAIKKRMDLELFNEPVQLKVKDLTSMNFELPCNGVSLIEIVANRNKSNN
jgi:xylan 1,4-beta-xylosidase